MHLDAGSLIFETKRERTEVEVEVKDVEKQATLDQPKIQQWT